MEAAQLRASDADREAAVARLGAHAAAGRLDPAELEVRVEAALAARNTGELAHLEADLPRPARATRARRPAISHSLRTYVLVMALLIAIWALTGAGYFWPVWPALGWGVALLSPGWCHARTRGRGRRLTSG